MPKLSVIAATVLDMLHLLLSTHYLQDCINSIQLYMMSGTRILNDILVPVRCVGAHAWLWSADIGDMIVPHVYILYIVNHTLSFISTNCEELSFIWTHRLMSIEHSLRPASRHGCWLCVLVAGTSWELVNILIDLLIKCLYAWQKKNKFICSSSVLIELWFYVPLDTR